MFQSCVHGNCSNLTIIVSRSMLLKLNAIFFIQTPKEWLKILNADDLSKKTLQHNILKHLMYTVRVPVTYHSLSFISSGCCLILHAPHRHWHLMSYIWHCREEERGLSRRVRRQLQLWGQRRWRGREEEKEEKKEQKAQEREKEKTQERSFQVIMSRT